MKRFKTDQFDLRLMDCMDLMAEYEDNHFDLAIVDPPYGAGHHIGNRPSAVKFYKEKGATWNNKIPKDEYFKELKRVSKQQIIWGGNYFPYLWSVPCRGFIFWNKSNPAPGFADGELAWTSFDQNAKQLDFRYYGNIEGHTITIGKIHPTQKPVALYEWLFKNYAKEGDKIIDTHLGSMSIAIALDRMNKIEGMNLHLTGSELDKEYYDTAIKRVKLQTAQTTIF